MSITSGASSFHGSGQTRCLAASLHLTASCKYAPAKKKQGEGKTVGWYYSFWNFRLTFSKFAVKATTFCASCTILR